MVCRPTQGPYLVVARAAGRSRPQVRRAAASLRIASASAVLLVGAVALAAVSGLALAPLYDARPGAAHASVAAIEASPLLAAVRALHHWAAALALILGAWCIVRWLGARAYRVIGRAAWAAGIALVVLAVLLQLTGHLLPWDRQAVRTAAVETGITAGAPVIGPALARLARGGPEVGPPTLRLWYIAHVLILPTAAAACAWWLLRAARRRRSWARSTVRAGATLAAALVGACLLAAPPLGPAAAPADYTDYAARPEWYVLPLHSLLRLAEAAHPALGAAGAVAAPGALLAGLLALPWLDRRRRGRPRATWVGASAVAAVLATASLFLMSVGQMAPLVRQDRSAPLFAAERPPARLDRSLVEAGRRLVSSAGCLSCHSLAGRGGLSAPPLDHAGSRHADTDWHMRHLVDPAGLVPGSTMPSFQRLGERDLRALAAFLAGRR